MPRVRQMQDGGKAVRLYIETVFLLSNDVLIKCIIEQSK